MVFKAYDIRGKYPIEVDEEFSYNIGRALGEKYKNILFGIDSRIGSDRIKDYFITGVLDSNAKVEYAGIISTPLLYFSTKDKFDVGVIATASHNPKEFTGFKICGKDGIPLSPERDIKPEFKEYRMPHRIYDSEDFSSDMKSIDAVIRNLEIIGEATKNISEDFKNRYPDVNWKDPTRMRDRLIHAYFGVDLGIVWETIKFRIPELKKQIEKISKDTG